MLGTQGGKLLGFQVYWTSKNTVGNPIIYCDVPDSPCLSKKRVKCTVRFFLKIFIGTHVVHLLTD